MPFQDQFASLAREYAQHRPVYPSALFGALASLTANHECAWDCGTGSGQAALELTRHYQRVIATDGSAGQIAHAPRHPQIEYHVEQADRTSMKADSVDLVTVATAVHWFPLEAFYREVKRTLRHTGVLAVWTYHLPVVDTHLDAILARYYHDIVGPYWADGIQYAFEKYKNLPFPFEEVEFPSFSIEAEWDLNRLLGFLSSWSATGNYLAQTGSHPLHLILPDLQKAWGDPAATKLIRWPLYMRVGRPR